MHRLHIDAVNLDSFSFLSLHHLKLLMNSVRPMKQFCVSLCLECTVQHFECVQGHSRYTFTAGFKDPRFGQPFGWHSEVCIIFEASKPL